MTPPIFAEMAWPDKKAYDWSRATFGKSAAPLPPPAPTPNHEKKFMVDGELVPVPEIRDKLFTSAATKKAKPIALSNGGFGFIK
eukprot:g3433.t1